MGYHQIKKLLHIKGNNYQNQETTHRMGKIFASYSLDKELISRIYKELKNLNTRRSNNPVNKWPNELNKYFSKEVQMANKYMKECLIFLVIKKLQTKMTLRFYLLIRKIGTNTDKGTVEKGNIIHLWLGCKLVKQ
jgi:hypothetical protein